MIVGLARCLISLEFLSRIPTSSSNPSTESWRPISTGRLREIPGEGMSWRTQRESNALYADKSVYLEYLLEIVPRNVFFYITRPRRFGKTSFLTMAHEFFDGNETLFKGLHIYDRGNADFFKKPYGGMPEELKDKKWIQCPVIYLDFRKIDNFNTMADFERHYTQMLQDIAKFYGLEYSLERVSAMSVSHLIFELEFKFKLRVVVLVDEYDSPFQDALENLKDRELAKEIRRFLDKLFGAIKTNVEQLRLVLVLGISRLGLTSLQSGPNNYVDLTYREEFAGAFGFTSEEIVDFHPEIANLFNLSSMEGIDGFLGELKKEYDGYNFTFQYKNGKKKNVLNPISTMKCLEKKEFGCYWTETSCVNEVIRRLYFSKEPLESFERRKCLRKYIEKSRNPAMEAIPLEILMLVYGYLTVQSYNEKTKEVVLNFPNNEIKTALRDKIDDYEFSNDEFLSEEHGWLFELRWHMETGRLEGTMNTLRNLFDTTFSEKLRKALNEYSTVSRLVDKLRLAGISCRESVTFLKKVSKDEAGDVDVFTVRLRKNFIMSIKYGESSTKAMEQLVGYLKNHTTLFLNAIDRPKEAWFVGVNFDSRTGGSLHEWIGIPYKNGVLSYDQCKASIEELCEHFNKN